jgi:hypothetical protein
MRAVPAAPALRPVASAESPALLRARRRPDRGRRQAGSQAAVWGIAEDPRGDSPETGKALMDLRGTALAGAENLRMG